MATRIKKNDTVVVRSGKDKGKEGKVIFVSKNMVIVEGINIVKKPKLKHYNIVLVLVPHKKILSLSSKYINKINNYRCIISCSSLFNARISNS